MHSEIERDRHRIESEEQKDCTFSVPPNRTTTTDPTPQTTFVYQVLLKSVLIITNRRPKTGKGQIAEL